MELKFLLLFSSHLLIYFSVSLQSAVTATAAPQSQAAPAAPSGGRTSHRGGARTSAADVKTVSTDLAQMSLGTGDARPPQRSGGRFRSNDDEANTKPAHVTSKLG